MQSGRPYVERLFLGVPMLELSGTYDLTISNPTGFGEASEENPRFDAAAPEPPRLKVLLIVDDAARSRRTERALAHMSLFEPHVTTAGTVPAARFALTADEFDVVLVDASMRDNRGGDVLAVLAASLDSCPVLLLADAEGSSVSTSSIRTGAVSPKSLQLAIHKAIMAFAQRCSSSGQ